MSLDQNLFTLLLTPNKDNSNVVDLVDPSGTVHYRKQRLPGIEYKAEVYDPMSESLLVTATAPASTSKSKTLELRNPTTVVELRFTGTLSFRWGFKWEEHEFEWKREECFMVRKPDPPVLVAVTKEPAGRLKTKVIQILDYNLNRFDIEDRKGLEIVILTALLTFQDANEAYHTPTGGSPNSSSPEIGRKPSTPAPLPVVAAVPPSPPPKPAPKTGVDRIAEMQTNRGLFNEIAVEDEGYVNDYAQYCSNLLQDDAMLFVTIRSSAPDQVPKVLQVVEQTKRIRHKAGLEEELHQYVLYDTAEKQKGPRRIVLDDADKAKNKYTPPNSLTVHLSKISMPELQPKTHGNDKSSKDTKKKNDTKDDKKKDVGKKGDRKKEEKKASATLPPDSRLSRNQPPPSPIPPVYAHQIHPMQPSPSPSQLNNPSIYVAPPPIHRSSRPQSSYSPSPNPLAFPSPSPNTWAAPGPSFFNTAGPSPYGPGPYAPSYGAHSPYVPTPPAAPQEGPNTAGGPIKVIGGLFDKLHLR